MLKTTLLSLASLMSCASGLILNADWSPISLPNQFIVPAQANMFENIYSAQIPTQPLNWARTYECLKYEPTSVHWKSDLFTNVKGLSFKGLVFKLPELRGEGEPLNSFAVFFHDQECYTDGCEYGWVFHEDSLPKGEFYICEKCNLVGCQKWATWPSDKSPTLEVLEGDAKAVEAALQNSGVYRYWNIQLTVDGHFILQLVNPSDYKTVSVTLKRPEWLTNLYDMPGYITVVAKKQGKTTLKPAPIMHVDHVKVWKE